MMIGAMAFFDSPNNNYYSNTSVYICENSLVLFSSRESMFIHCVCMLSIFVPPPLSLSMLPVGGCYSRFLASTRVSVQIMNNEYTPTTERIIIDSEVKF